MPTENILKIHSCHRETIFESHLLNTPEREILGEISCTTIENSKMPGRQYVFRSCDMGPLSTCFGVHNESLSIIIQNQK